MEMDVYGELSKVIKGEVRKDKKTLKKYSTDASLFEVTPKAVVYPKSAEDIKSLVCFVSEHKKNNPELSLTVRSAGTDMSGGPLNDSIIVDVQNDFCPGGALPIDKGDEIVPVINRWIFAALAKGIPLYASRDWHPARHLSFQEEGGPWPVHCVQDTAGAGFHPDLRLPDSVIKVTKGVRFDRDQNSVFDGTGLAGQLRKNGIARLWVTGLAEDVCVLATVLDGRKEGFEVVLVEDATRSITRESGEKARQTMREAGARIVS